MSELKEQSRKLLSKQGSNQLLDKLKSGKLLGVSKEVAVEILTKRGVDLKGIDTPEVKTDKTAKAAKTEKPAKTDKAVKKEKTAKAEKVEKTPRAKPDFPEYGKKVKFTTSKQSSVGEKKVTGVIIARVKGSRNKEKFYFNIRTADGVFQKSPESLEFVKETKE